MENIIKIKKSVSFGFSAENPNGVKGGGSKGSAWEKVRPNICLDAGKTYILAETDGPGIIQNMWFTGDLSWNLILRIYWDEQIQPSVEAPLCAFFGYGFSNSLTNVDGKFPILNSAAILASPCLGLNCYWQMPFGKHCKITIENRSTSINRTLYYMITGQKTDVPSEGECAYFHASYRQEKPVKKNIEYTVIDGIYGTGHYVGTALFAGTNGNNGCWVEGEAKMFIDGDKYPSINYTGTEDYFGGAYAFGYDNGSLLKYQEYSGMYVGMYAVLGSSDKRYNNQPRFMAYRWHLPDPIHFISDFRMTLQDIGNFANGQHTRQDDFATVAYWYQT